MTAKRLRFSIAVSFVTCVSLAVAPALAASASGSGATSVAAIPRLHAPHMRVKEVDGRSYMLIPSMEVYPIADLKLNLICPGCVRLSAKPVAISYPHRGVKLFSHANWLLRKGQTIQLALFRSGVIGRYLQLGASFADDKLVVVKTGCLASATKFTACPTGVTAPKVGTVVAPAPAAPSGPSTTSAPSATTPSGSSPSTTTTTAPVVTPVYALDVSKAGTGGGTVSGTGITCGGTCSGSYTSGTTVTLSAGPTTGSIFTGWSGACSGTSTCTIPMTAARSVTANFTLQTETLTVSFAGNGSGSVSGSGVSCTGSCSETYSYGTAVTLAASTSAAYTSFAGWGGSCGGTGSCTVTMTGAITVTASFSYSPPAPPPAPTVWNETVGGNTNTWTNYTNAGGTQGPTIPNGATVQISCKLQGFKVADGNTWWYRIHSSPWNDTFYASADAFYNNGATSGSLVGTPFVDNAVANC